MNRLKCKFPFSVVMIYGIGFRPTYAPRLPLQKERMRHMIRKHIIVHGKVQGVGFRYYVNQSARRIGICGWVRNLPDGTVEIDAEGPVTQMKTFVEAVKKGSPRSKVTNLEVRDKEPAGFQRFEIRR